MSMADRIAVMDAGKIQQIGPPGEIYHRPVNRLVAGFIGSPPMNFFAGSLAKQNVLEIDELGFRLNLDPDYSSQLQVGEVTVGIRPEHISLAENGEGLPAKVVLAEPLGDKTVILAQVKDVELTLVEYELVDLSFEQRIGAVICGREYPR